MQFSSAHIRVLQLCAVLLLFPCLWAREGSVHGPSAPGRPQRAQFSQAPVVAAPESATVHEDWSSLSLAQSALRAETPLVGEKDESAEFTRELVQVQWRPSDRIDLYLIRPRGVQKPPVILYLYSYPSETDRFLSEGYCQRVTRNGFAAVGFVSALTGHRYHDRPMRQWFVSELQEALGSSAHDVQMVLNYLSTREDVDVSRVGMFGVGSGATIAILAAAADARIKALDLLDPWGEWRDWLAKSSLVPEAEREDYLKPEFLKRVGPLDPVRWLPQLGSRRIRLQHVLDDSVTPAICKQRIESAAPGSAQIVRYEDTPALYKASSGGQLFQWIKQQVAATPRLESTANLSPTGQEVKAGVEH